MKYFPWDKLINKELESPFIPEKKDNFDKKYCEAVDSINIETKIRYEKYNQIISPKETQTLKIFNIEHPDYMIETSNTCYSITFNTMQEQEKRIQLNKKITALIQANGIKMKVTFYLIEELKRFNSVSIKLLINIFSLSIIPFVAIIIS